MTLTTNHLRNQHAQLLKLADELRSIGSKRQLRSYPEDARAAIDRLAAYLRQHLEAEDRGLYVQMQQLPDPIARATAQRFAAEMGGLAGSFDAYVRTWTTAAINGDSRGFMTSTNEVLEELRARVEREDKTLYPLADGLAISVAGSEKPSHGGEALIYIVDDNDGDFLLLSEAWRETKTPCRFEHFRVAENLLNRISELAVPDLIVVDINMPIIGGLELTKRLRTIEAYVRKPIVVCSSSFASTDSDRAMASGATGFFPKPSTFDEYLPFVRAMNDLIEYHRQQ